MSGQPLLGMRVVVTRSREQMANFADKLSVLGAEVIVFPTIAIAPLEDTSPLDEALMQLGSYDWIIFTSVNGVRHFWQRADDIGVRLDGLHDRSVAAIGPATVESLRTHGVEPDVVPAEFVAEAVIKSLPEVKGLRILLPRADIARVVLRDELTARGAQVDDVAVYRTLRGQPDRDDFETLRDGVDLITFTSASTVRNFASIVGDEMESILRDARVACIGPITAQAAHQLGLPVHTIADDYTSNGLIEAIISARGAKIARVDIP